MVVLLEGSPISTEELWSSDQSPSLKKLLFSKNYKNVKMKSGAYICIHPL
jgi:hypothetical protein